MLASNPLSSSSTLASLGSYAKLSPEFISGVKEEGRKRLAGLQNWRTFFDPNLFRKPSDFTSFKKRFDFNIMFFTNNYILIALVVLAYFLLTNLWLLTGAVFAIGGSKYISSLPANQPIVIMGQSVTSMHLWIGYGVICFFFFYFTGI